MKGGVPVGVCLQCEQSREEVKANSTICGIEEGYECRELVAEWPRHHWRDWSDAELKQAGLKPEFFDLHRRDPIYQLPYAACEHLERGHVFPKEDLYWGDHDFPKEDIYWGDVIFHPKGKCVYCTAKQELIDQEDQ